MQWSWKSQPEFGDGVLRVVVKTGVKPKRLITIF